MRSRRTLALAVAASAIPCTAFAQAPLLLQPKPAPSASAVEMVRLVELTGDRLPDKLHIDAKGMLSVSVNVGAGTFVEAGQPLATHIGRVNCVLSGDLTGDGLADLYLVGTEKCVALVGDGRGGLADRTVELGLDDDGVGLSAERVDLDGAGAAELVLHDEDSDVIFWARDGFFVRDPLSPRRSMSAVNAQPAAGLDPASASAETNADQPDDSDDAGSSTRRAVRIVRHHVAGPAPGDVLPPQPPPPPEAVTGFWATSGNTATNPATHYLGTKDAADLVLRTNDVEKLRILSGGNVGIGTSTPSALLHVAGQSRFDNNVGIGTATPSALLHVAGQSRFDDNVGIGTATPSALLHVAGQSRFDDMVGIGTATPSALLHVAGKSRFEDQAYFAPLGSLSARLQFQSELTDSAEIFSENYGGSNLNRLVLQTGDDGEQDYTVIRNNYYAAGPKDVMEIHRSYVGVDANLGVGIMNPTHRLHVVGSMRYVDGTQSAGAILFSDANGVASWGPAFARILHNEATDSGSNIQGTGNTSFSFGKQFLMPGNTMANDGDEVKIRVTLTCGGAGTYTAGIRVAGVGVANITSIVSGDVVTMEAVVNRVSSNSQRATSTSVHSGASVVKVTDMTNNLATPLLIDIPFSQVNGVFSGLVCKQIVVEYLKK